MLYNIFKITFLLAKTQVSLRKCVAWSDYSCPTQVILKAHLFYQYFYNPSDYRT